MADKQRCNWANSSPAMQAYHDNEWGRPTYDDHELFERLCMETYQAGLSWATVLNKRAAFHRDFHDYRIEAVAAMTPTEIDAAMQDAAIIRNRRKLEATVNNAQAFLRIVTEFGSFATYFWTFVGAPQQNTWTDYRDAPAQTPTSAALAKDLKKRGFKFLGPVATYAFMQSVGAVNDHEINCAWR
ncbi:DNA-3-methyladenine glycosylase I [Loigolactobacillus coryniformis]|uniref:DNA-3-methyladenine glycosylase I n=1 Tax=Loigolactobacillus coryniformis TaxID=1610 RepID=UPI002340FB56|nr:DNA-3-methyladenine glycosylase I [Loigolactobacillus coryniformis]